MAGLLRSHVFPSIAATFEVDESRLFLRDQFLVKYEAGRQQLLRPERGGRVEGGGLLGRERRLLELELGALIMNHEPLRMSEGRLLGSSHLAPWYDRPRER